MQEQNQSSTSTMPPKKKKKKLQTFYTSEIKFKKIKLQPPLFADATAACGTSTLTHGTSTLTHQQRKNARLVIKMCAVRLNDRGPNC